MALSHFISSSYSTIDAILVAFRRERAEHDGSPRPLLSLLASRKRTPISSVAIANPLDRLPRECLKHRAPETVDINGTPRPQKASSIRVMNSRPYALGCQ